VNVTKSLWRGPNGSFVGSVKITDRVPGAICPDAGRVPVITAFSKLRTVRASLKSVLVVRIGFPSSRSDIVSVAEVAVVAITNSVDKTVAICVVRGMFILRFLAEVRFLVLLVLSGV
jgi:hypothetical protein